MIQLWDSPRKCGVDFGFEVLHALHGLVIFFAESLIAFGCVKSHNFHGGNGLASLVQSWRLHLVFFSQEIHLVPYNPDNKKVINQIYLHL